MKAIGFDLVSDFLKNLRSGRALLVIDAFDEAELISGRAAIEFLLQDLISVAANSHCCSFVLLARTDTARYISSFFIDNQVPFCHYEIGFFTEYYSKEFIKKSLELKGRPYTQIVSQCIDQQFAQIRNILKDESLIDSFIGYAPVLEALSIAYDEERNTVKLLNGLATLNCTEKIR